MRPLSQVADLPLTLHKPSWKSGVHELRAGDGIGVSKQAR